MKIKLQLRFWEIELMVLVEVLGKLFFVIGNKTISDRLNLYVTFLNLRVKTVLLVCFSVQGKIF